MDNWIQRIFLISIGVFSLAVLAAEENSPQSVYDPVIDQQKIDEALIDDESFDIGLVFGTLSIEDFGATELYGLRLNYFVNEDLFVQATYATATAGLSSAEQLFPGNALVSSERDFEFYDVSLGWNILPGEAFWSDNLTVNTAFYVIAGAGNTEFLGNTEFTYTYGAGYRALINDWLAFSVDTRDHVFNTDYPVGEEKATHNLEFSFSFSIFF